MIMKNKKFGGRLSMLVFIAWRNLWRNKMRSILTISALAGGLALMIVYTTLIQGMSKQMINFATNISIGYLQVHRQSYIDDHDIYATMPWDLLNHLEKKQAYKFAPRLYGAGLGAAGNLSTGIMLKAIDPEKERQVTTIMDHVRMGKADLALVQSSGQDDPALDIYGVVIGAQLAKNLKVSPGDELIIITQAIDGSIGNGLFRVTGILKPIEPNFDRTGVLMSVPAIQSLIYLENGFHELAVSINEKDDLNERKISLQEDLSAWSKNNETTNSSSYDPIVVRSWRDIVSSIADMLDINKSIIYVIGGIMIGLASLGMMNTMLMAIHERTHEFGILLSIGMGRYWLLFMVLLESFFLSLVSAVAGGLLGIGYSLYLERYGIDLSGSLPDGVDIGGILWEPVWLGSFTPDSVFVGIIIMISIAMLASLIPSWRTVRLSPVEITR